MGVIAGKAKRGHFLGLAMLEFSRDLLIAATCFQSEYLERPNVRAKLAPTVWRAGRLAQNGPQALRQTTSVTRRWCSA
jgi:hypothetical protein